MTAGYVLFRLGGRSFATRLDDVREIVRLSGLEPLPGAQPPLAGLIVLRGVPLPVLDARGSEVAGPPDDGDVLVLARGTDRVGVAVDRVQAVLAADDLEPGDPPASSLPAYVVEVRQRGGAPVLVVELPALLDAVATGWSESLALAQT